MTGQVLGQVVAPSGTVVLACGGSLDAWAELGEPLSVRAMRAAEAGGASLRDRLAEAVAVPAGSGALTVTADTRAGAYAPADDGDAIAVLHIDLDLPWSAVSSGTDSVVLGDLPVDRCGMVIGDAHALDSWVGVVYGTQPVDGLADLTIWGKGEEETCEHFDVPLLPTSPVDGGRGWLDLPVEVANQRAAAINDWASAPGLLLAPGPRRRAHPPPSRPAGRLSEPPRCGSDRGGRLPDLVCGLVVGRTSALHRWQAVRAGLPADHRERRRQGRPAMEDPADGGRGRPVADRSIASVGLTCRSRSGRASSSRGLDGRPECAPRPRNLGACPCPVLASGGRAAHPPTRSPRRLDRAVRASVRPRAARDGPRPGRRRSRLDRQPCERAGPRQGPVGVHVIPARARAARRR
jgi:hypothetical protein